MSDRDIIKEIVRSGLESPWSLMGFFNKFKDYKYIYTLLTRKFI